MVYYHNNRRVFPKAISLQPDNPCDQTVSSALLIFYLAQHLRGGLQDTSEDAVHSVCCLLLVITVTALAYDFNINALF